jgi:hypothetical protein
VWIMRVHTDTRYGRSSIHQATLLVFLVMGGLAGLATPAKADTIFTSIIGSGIGGPGVQGPSEPGGSESLAEAFTPAAEYELTDVQVEVFQVLGFGSDPYFNVSLFSNASGVPGSLIDTLGTDLTAPVGVGSRDSLGDGVAERRHRVLGGRGEPVCAGRRHCIHYRSKWMEFFFGNRRPPTSGRWHPNS